MPHEQEGMAHRRSGQTRPRYLIGQFAPPRNPGTLSLESGTYCCDRIDIAQKCIKKVTACPVDKPITVLVP